MANRKLTSKEYWDRDRKEEFKPYKVKKPSYWKIVEKYLPQNEAMTCAEIGAYPGGFLCNCVKSFGYIPTAIEYSPYYKDIGSLLEYNGISNYQLINEDFFDLKGLKFDVITSFGFVEHFDDLTEIIGKQSNLLKEEGYIVIGMPYFGGLQEWIRKRVYTVEGMTEIKQTHNTRIMNLPSLIQAMKKNEIEILFADYVGKAIIWLNPSSHLIRRDRKWLLVLLKGIEKSVRLFLPSCKLWSPYILAIGRKRGISG